MSRPRTGTRGVPRAQREASILRAATDLFGVHGYANVSIAAVAEQADVSKALVLSYFGNKEGLFIQCASAVAQRLHEPIVAAVQGVAPGLPMATHSLRAIFETLADHPRDWYLLHDPTLPADSPVSAQVREVNQPFHELGRYGVTVLLDSGAEQVDLLDASALQVVWDGVVASAMAWWSAHPEETPESMTARVGRIMTALSAQLDPTAD